MSHQNGYIYGPPPAPPPKATGPPPSFNSSQNNQFSRGNYGNRGRGNNRSGGRGNFNNRGGSNQSQGRGGYTNFGTHPPHASPPQPLYPVAGAYQAPAVPPYTPPAHQTPSNYSTPAPPSTFQARPPHQASQYQPPPQAFGHQPPPPQPRPPYPQPTGYNSAQTNSYGQATNRWPQPSPVPPPPQHQTPAATPQPLRFFPQQPPPPTSYAPSQPLHPSPAATFQPNQSYGKPPPPPPQTPAQSHNSFPPQSVRPHRSYSDLRVDGRVRPPAPPSVPTFFGSSPSSLPQPPPSLPPHPPPPSGFSQHMPNQQQRHNQHHNHNQHHSQHNRNNRGNFGHRNNGFNHDRRNKDRGHRNHHQNQNQQFQAPQNSDLDMSPEEYALWLAAGGKIKGTDITLKDPAELDKWLEERKKKWPTAARIAERKAEDDEKQRVDQNEALKKKLDSLNQTESQLRKRKLDEVVDDEDKSKQQSKKKKKKKKKKRPQDDAPVAFEENSAAPDADTVAPTGEPESVTVEEPADGPSADPSGSNLENDITEAEAVTLAALEEDFLAMDELVESGDTQQVELVTESALEGQALPAAADQGEDVIVEEPFDNMVELKDVEDAAAPEADDDSESVAMSTSTNTADSAAETAEDGSDNESGSAEGSDESDEDAPPEESTAKPSGLPEKPPPAANPNKQKQVCKLWLKKNCRYGAKCKYLHEGGVPKTDKERREEKKQQKEAKPKEMSLYDKLMQAQMEKENVKLLQAINFFVEKEVLKV
ncbi:hypothetical protein TWF730_002328 [Orbilia blumenaviensis]|uniref:C3H1-type domain-containing protein n=1 Tax=Orbilia blumenaviensis TaxID=1796055 RepID=A0AAV9UE24_9PEZI